MKKFSIFLLLFLIFSKPFPILAITPQYIYSTSFCNCPIHAISLDLTDPNLSYRIITADDARPSPEENAAWADGKRHNETLGNMLKRHDFQIGINTDYFGKGGPEGTLIQNGNLVRTLPGRSFLALGETNKIFEQEKKAAILISTKDIFSQNSWIKEAVGGGPIILKDGFYTNMINEENFLPTIFSESRRVTRSGAGISPNGKTLIIAVADGEKTGSGIGCTLKEFADFFASLGAQEAFCFDGGGSSSLWYNYQLVTTPSDGRERKIVEALAFNYQYPYPFKKVFFIKQKTVHLKEYLKHSHLITKND